MGRPLAALAALGVLTAGLAGCAHQKTSTPGYAWAFLSDGGDAPRLAYGRPSSDDVVLMLTCQPGADRMRLSAAGMSGREIVLSSGRTQSRFPAKVADSALVETGLLEADGKTSAPALDGFKRTGQLAVVATGETHSLDATARDRGQVKAFFKTCET